MMAVVLVLMMMIWCSAIPGQTAQAMSDPFFRAYVSYRDGAVFRIAVDYYLSNLLPVQVGVLMVNDGIDANNITEFSVDGSSGGISPHDIWWIRDTFPNLEEFELETTPYYYTIPNNAFHASIIGGGHANLQRVYGDDETDIKHIGDYAFNMCPKLNSVHLSNVVTIGRGAFANSGTQISSVEEQGEVREKKLDRLVFDDVTDVGANAFEGCIYLEDVFLKSVQNIGAYAFLNCTSLKNADYKRATSIGTGAFAQCTALRYADISSVTVVQPNTFENCTNLKFLYTSQVQRIESYAFKNCDSLEAVSFPETTDVGWGAFEESGQLMTVNLPLATHVDDYAFYNCVNLQNVYLPQVRRIDGHAFLNNRSLSNMNLPLATDIGPNAFKNATALKSIYLPDATTLESGAFENCTQLDTLLLGGTVPTVGSDVFTGCPSNRTVYIPSYAVGDYDPDGDGLWQGWTIATSSTACSIYGFAVEDASGQLYHGTFEGPLGHEIQITVPYGTDVTSLKPVIDYASLAAISPGNGVVNDFTTSRVPYNVTAQNPGFKKRYYVTVHVADNTEKDILTFDFNDISPPVVGQIDAQMREIHLVLPHGTSRTTFAPTITLSEAASVQPSSGVLQDFTDPIVYTVTAQDGSTQTYTAAISVANQLPTLQSGVVSPRSAQVHIDTPYTLDLSHIFDDPDHDPLTYTVSVDGAAAVSASPLYTYTPTDFDEVHLAFTAHDGYGESVDRFNVLLQAVNTVPNRISGIPATNTESLVIGDTYTLDLSTIFEDGDTDPLTYRVSVDGAAAVLAPTDYQYTPATVGSTQLIFQAHDGYSISVDTYTVNLTTQPIAVTDVDIHPADLRMDVGTSEPISRLLPYTLIPSSATYPGVTWHSSNPHVATVDALTGQITAHAVGKTRIMLTSVDATHGPPSDTCIVEVIDPTPEPTGVHRGNITGTVVDPDGQPIAHQVVTLYSEPIAVTTDSAGRFQFIDVPYTQHTLVVNTPDYAEVGRFAMTFTRGQRVNAHVDNVDNSIHVTYVQSTRDVIMEVEADLVEMDINISDTIVRYRVDNPATGDGMVR